jgi:hypothetical protein
MLYQLFIVPLSQGKAKGLIDVDCVRTLFGNIPEILRIDTVLLQDLEKECTNPDTARVGRVLLELVRRYLCTVMPW